MSGAGVQHVLGLEFRPHMLTGAGVQNRRANNMRNQYPVGAARRGLTRAFCNEIPALVCPSPRRSRDYYGRGIAGSWYKCLEICEGFNQQASHWQQRSPTTLSSIHPSSHGFHLARSGQRLRPRPQQLLPEDPRDAERDLLHRHWPRAGRQIHGNSDAQEHREVIHGHCCRCEVGQGGRSAEGNASSWSGEVGKRRKEQMNIHLQSPGNQLFLLFVAHQ